jgi:hypothetical protein
MGKFAPLMKSGLLKSGLAVGAAVVLLCYFYVAGFYANYSNGFRVGVIQKASAKGIVCKSIEAEIVLDGFGSTVTQRQGPSPMRTTWSFSARDPKVMAELERLSVLPGQRVRITYRQWLRKPWCGETDYEAVAVQPVE